ncbi:hypothetical protein B296_00048540 [Ensete ventricosum]|uniref:Uncharacterized protein n=1 Tax=Ensete ventricosum TaxID=4639 RepID=A0A426YU93_ENSVE|nr:hypothetical protein B296_00048540 [Ensete ventricosum]
MGESKYHSFLIYLVDELCTGSKTLLRNLVEDNSCQILTNSDKCSQSRLSVSFSNRIPIESESDTNLLDGND